MNVHSQPSVVVGVDGSGESLVAAHWAAHEAAHRRCALRVVHGFTEPAASYPGYVLPLEEKRKLQSAAQQVLDGAVRAIAATVPHLQVTTRLVHADPRSALVEASAGAALTVVGSRGRGRLPDVLLGSVALYTASHGLSPVAVIPPNAMPDDKPGAGPILLGVNAKPNCEAAVGYAFEEAARYRSDVIAALVVDDTAVPTFVRGAARTGSLQNRDEEAILAAQLAGWGEKYPTVNVRTMVLQGRPARALMDYGLGLPPATTRG